MKYQLSFQNPSRHYLDIELIAKTEGEKTLQFQLPAWRPGRYELGNFAKNIQQWKAFDENGQVLNSKKLTKDLWEVNCEKADSVHIKYNYYSIDLNAGSTYLDEFQLYVNPVNCLMYIPNRQEEKCSIVLELPEDYKVATGLNSLGNNVFETANFDELADCPFIASNSLKKITYQVANTTFYMWFQGECKLDEAKLVRDFTAFTKAQMDLFGDFPTKEYHFLFQILPHQAYHGVEHSNSTVIALGPSYSIMDEKGRYEDLLGVSSHELFHTWNVKRIRPIEMQPYEFSKENYSRLGYLCEGATTWYGDEMLMRSKVFGDEAYFKTLNQLLDRHFNNPGVENLSVAESSFDTWLDGYVPGVPNRKSSIYVEGALITFMLDSIIKRNSNQKYSFDDVMLCFYEEYYKKNKGVSEADYKQVVERFANDNLDDFFAKYINGAENIEEQLKLSFQDIGLNYERNPADLFHEAYLGFKYIEDKVFSIYPDSTSELNGLSVGDTIHTVNGYKVNDDLAAWCKYFKDVDIYFGVTDSHGIAKVVCVEVTDEVYYASYRVSRV
ncbi:MAG: M61 family peptidase [Bacteroidetes bacterium]|nr:MAG: M61 family peptidase [Bacteroidota bacterium]MBL1145437.1 M61 family peptidase [Bacteroidota bacterium]NOG58235.1 M61 family metallopeptidase [Bacteroidota bacterium]